MFEIAAQLVGFFGAALFALAFQCKSSRRMIILQAVSGVVFGVHYLMLGGYTGCVMQLLFSANSYVLCAQDKAWASWRGWKWCFTGIVIILTALTWQSRLSLLPCISAVTSTLANWSRNGKVIRVARLGVISPSWLLYDVFVRSYSGILCEAISMGSVAISIYRYGLKELDQIN